MSYQYPICHNISYRIISNASQDTFCIRKSAPGSLSDQSDVAHSLFVLKTQYAPDVIFDEVFARHRIK
jgi:hypothetical protein